MYGNLLQDSNPLVLYNTGTFLDLMAGNYSLGSDDKFYLNGGLGTFITGFHGRGNTYKSTFINSIIMGMLRNYTDVNCIDYDTEHSKDKLRVLEFVKGGMYPSDSNDVAGRYILKAGGEWTLKQLWTDVKVLCELREKHKKELMVDSPFVDYHGKPLRVWRPDVVCIDTLTELKSVAEHDKLGGKDFEDKKNKTVYLDDGNKKTMLLSALNKYCAQYGLVIVCTAHTGDNFSMDNAPPRKELTFQKQNDKIKGVGSKYTTLTHVLAQVASCRLCVDSNKTALYKHGETSDVDLQELQVVISRNKVRASGLMIPFVVSQENGLLNEISYLHFLRAHGYEGLAKGPSAPKNSLVWYPEVKFSRNDIREKLTSDYQLCRALELTAKYRYIQLSWNLKKLPFDFTRTPEQVFDGFMKSKVKMPEILESTSTWNWQKQERPTLTLFDIIGMID